MSDKLKYIDDLVKNNLTDFKMKPERSWSNFVTENKSGQYSTLEIFLERTLTFFSQKYALLTMAVGAIGVVIYLFADFDSSNKSNTKGNEQQMHQHFKTSAFELSDDSVQYDLGIKDTLSGGVSDTKTENVDNKNVESNANITGQNDNLVIRKTIFVRDTIRYTDTVKVYKSAIDSMLQDRDKQD